MSDADDVQIESEDPEADAKAEKKVAKLKEEIEQLRKERQEYLDGWQRAKADYVNALRRFEGDTKRAASDGVAKAAIALLPAHDALERAKEHGELPPGFDAIAKQFESAFTLLGLEAVGQVGDAFDPKLHEALGQDTVDDNESDEKITAVLEKGWRIGENVIRAAKVRVGKH